MVLLDGFLRDGVVRVFLIVYLVLVRFWGWKVMKGIVVIGFSDGVWVGVLFLKLFGKRSGDYVEWGW